MRVVRWCVLLTLCAGLTGSIVGCDAPMDKFATASQTSGSPKSRVTSVLQQPPLKTKPDPVAHVVVYDTGRHPKVMGLRKFPFPYQAMLAISSDADSETLRKFNLVHEFINTTDRTPLGPGLGLDFSDSFFLYNGTDEPNSVDINNQPMSDELSYFKGVSDEYYAASVINHYIHSGWIDTMHSYGDFSQVNQTKTLFTRSLASQAVQALKVNDDVITVWTDHGNKSNVDNFGAYGDNPFYSYQQGANPWSSFYHTNWTIPYGIKFVWSDMSSDKFGMKSMIYPAYLPDGRHVWGFWRYTTTNYNNLGDPLWNWSPYDLDEQITVANLKQIERQHEYSIVAQHLSGTTLADVLPESAVQALQSLAAQYHDGKILVARTSRLLNYNVAQEYVKYDTTYSSTVAYIHIREIADPVLGPYVPSVDDVRGLTFYTTNPAKTVIEIGNTPIPDNLMQENESDGVGLSVSIKWFPPDTTNYTETMPGVE